MTRVVAAGLVVVGLLGCRGQAEDLWPLRVGAQATYLTRTEFGTRMIETRLAEAPPVLGEAAVRMESPMGPVWVAWRRGELVAASIGGSRFDPPLPLVAVGRPKETITWRGKVESLSGSASGAAQLQQVASEITVAGRTHASVRATLQMQILDTETELVTHFVRGLGPVWQEQRTDGRFDFGFEWLRG